MSGDISIERLDGESADWDSFVHSHPDGTFFHLSVWKGIFEDVLRHRAWYFFAVQAGQIVAVLPLVEVRSLLFGHCLTSLPFCAYGGAVGGRSAVAALEKRADALAGELGVQYVEYRNLKQRHEDWPSQNLYVTFRKEISADEDQNLKSIPRKQRAMVRKAMKRDLRSEVDEDIGRFFNLYADNVRRHGTPGMSRQYFAELHSRFGEACEILTVSDPSGKPVSSVMSFYFRNEILPYYAGDAVSARALAANDFKYWELMRRSGERGCTLFDYGRSKVGTGPWSFKKNWGFEPIPLSYEYRLLKSDSVPQKNPLNPKYRLFIAAWRRLPLPVANLLGPRIARNLG